MFMIGAIIGDVVGSRYEWDNNRSKDFELFGEDNRATDDSIMSLAVAKSLLDCDGNYDNLKDVTIKNMVEIGRKYPNCGFGGKFYHWIMTDNHEPYNSFGNGSAMRVSSCGIVGKDLDEVKKLSKIVTDVSHNHPEGEKGAEAIACAVYLANNGSSKEEIEEFIRTNYYDIDYVLPEIMYDYTFDVTCAGSVPQALEAFFESDSFEDTIRNAISIGGDSDTIAAMAGSVAAAYYGVPEDIKEKALSYLSPDLLEIYNNFENKYPLNKKEISKTR